MTNTPSSVRRRGWTSCRPRCCACRPMRSRTGTRGAGRWPPGIASCCHRRRLSRQRSPRPVGVHVFVVRVAARDAFRAHLEAHGVAHRRPLSRAAAPPGRVSQPGPSARRFSGDGAAVAGVVSLPMHPFIERAQVQYIADLAAGRFFSDPILSGRHHDDQSRRDRLRLLGPESCAQSRGHRRRRGAAIADGAARSPRRGGAASSRRTLVADAAELMARDDLDAVVIATPLDTHYALAKAAIERGKHVLVEKPLAASRARRRGARRARREARRPADGRSHVRLYWCRSRDPRRWSIRGELGELLYLDSVRVNLGLFQQDATSSGIWRRTICRSWTI